MASIQGVYVALFGRPADPTGLAYFNSVTKNGADLNGIGDLASTQEYKDRFAGQNNVQIVNSIFQSLFGRDADAAGLAFFVNALNTGAQSIKTIAINILDGAQGSDKTTVGNKVAAADLYTKALDTGPEIVAYSGNAAAAQGRTFLSGVSSTVPTQAAVDTAVAAMVTASNGGGTGTDGTILTLTAANDTITTTSTSDATKSTAGNDTIRTTANNQLNSGDFIDGGAGTDTLNATITTGADLKPVLRSIENVNLTLDATVAAATKFDLGDSTGVAKLSVDKIAVATNQTVTLAGVDNSTVVTISNIKADDGAGVANDTSVTATVDVQFKNTSGATDAGTVSVSGVTVGADAPGLTDGTDHVVIKAAGIETLTINSTGAAGSVNTFGINDAAATKWVVTGDRDFTFDATGSDRTALKTVDASAFTGKLTYTASGNGETILGGTKGDAITLGAGNDTIKYVAGNVSTLNNQDTIGGFAAGTNATSVDKIDLSAFSLGADTTIGATNLSPAGDTAGFFSGTNHIVFNDATKVLYVDIDKDGVFDAASDIAVTLTGVSAANLDKGDFVL